MARTLVVIAHPLQDSYCLALARSAIEALEKAGHAVDVIDLYRDDFDARMTKDERRNHHAVKDENSRLPPYAGLIRAAEHLVLVFPHWWFHMPAILKGFFDRCFAPGVAFTHVAGSGQFIPLLTRLRRVSVITTLGSPAWYHYLVLWQPVRRALRHAILRTCAPQARLGIKVLHDIERSTLEQRQAFLAETAAWVADSRHG